MAEEALHPPDDVHKPEHVVSNDIQARLCSLVQSGKPVVLFHRPQEFRLVGSKTRNKVDGSAGRSYTRRLGKPGGEFSPKDREGMCLSVSTASLYYIDDVFMHLIYIATNCPMYRLLKEAKQKAMGEHTHLKF